MEKATDWWKAQNGKDFDGDNFCCGKRSLGSHCKREKKKRALFSGVDYGEGKRVRNKPGKTKRGPLIVHTKATDLNKTQTTGSRAGRKK